MTIGKNGAKEKKPKNITKITPKIGQIIIDLC
jgi:hypothetical protein